MQAAAFSMLSQATCLHLTCLILVSRYDRSSAAACIKKPWWFYTVKLQVVAWIYIWSKDVVLYVTAACSVFLVFEYCAHDLGRLLDTMPRRFHESEVKCLLKQVQ